MVGQVHDRALSQECAVCGRRFRGIESGPLRIFGAKRSAKNPNLCSRCAAHFPEGEVREITAFFGDLSGFTELTQRVGPERTHAVVDGFLRTASQIIVRNDGYVDKYIGDAVMAVFNAPIRREDHRARAVRAGLELQAAMPHVSKQVGVPIQSTIGIASGLAHVGRLGSDDGGGGTAIGEVVNLAARLQSTARAGEVVVSRDVFQEVQTDFPNVAREHAQLKGFAQPVEAFRILASSPLPSHQPALPAAVRRIPEFGALLFGVLGAPCVLAGALSPIALAIGIAAAAGGGAGVLTSLDRDAIRLPLMGLAVLASAANVLALLHARRARARAKEQGRFVSMTGAEHRRERLIVWLSAVVAILAVLEPVFHRLMH